MNGPDHYRRAEVLLERAEVIVRKIGWVDGAHEIDPMLRAAGVHAQLAGVSAAAAPIVRRYLDGVMTVAHVDAAGEGGVTRWIDVLGASPEPDEAGP